MIKLMHISWQLNLNGVIRMKIKKHLFATFSVFLACSNTSLANPLDKTNIKFNGYIKADALWSDYSDGTLAPGSLGRDFYIPSLTPVGGNSEGVQFDTHARQTRFRFTSDTDLDNGEKLIGVLELDFLVTPDGNERISNSYNPRVRHAFIKYKNWTIGQAWTTMLDVQALPETLDFIGTTDGLLFNRQPLIRYSNNGFEFALENPETTVTPFGGGGRIVTDDNSLPDMVVRYTAKGEGGHFKIAGIVRQLSYVDKQGGANIDSTETGFGINLTGKIMLGRDDLRLMAGFGSGLGRYISLNAANGAVLNANGELEAIDSYGFGIAYRHLWSDQWRSTFTYSFFDADNDTALTGTGVTDTTFSSRVNVLYSPVKQMTVGAEVTFAERTLESDADGNLTRLQFSATYKF